MSRLGASIAVVLVSAAAACGDDDATGQVATTTAERETTTTTRPSPDNGGAGTYEWVAPSGAVFTFEIPASSDNEDAVDVEAYRLAVGGETLEATYIGASIDNTNGDEEVSMPGLSVVTTGGETFEFHEAWSLIGDWQDAIDVNDSELYNRGVDLYNSFLERGSALPGARTTTVLAADGLVIDFARVFIEDWDAGTVELERTR